MAKTKPNTYKSINNNRILTCGTRDKAYRQTVSRDSRGRKKSTVPQVSQVGSSHYIGIPISVE